jgi:hypothetical protein
MKITEEVMNDLMPLYFANECSNGTKQIVEEYFREHQEFEQQSRHQYKDPFAGNIIPSLPRNEEVRALKSTRRWIKARSFVLAFAIFFSLCPFSFYRNGDTSVFLFLDRPSEALIYVPFALVFWGIYFGMKRKLRAV